MIVVKYGRLLDELFARPGGPALRARIDEMPNPEYQRLLRLGPEELRRRLPGDGAHAAPIAELIAGIDDRILVDAVANLGGHDLTAWDAAFDAIDDARPTVIFAYTIKGFGLAGVADRSAHRTGHCRGQPGRLDLRARRDLKPLGPAPAADRCAL